MFVALYARASFKSVVRYQLFPDALLVSPAGSPSVEVPLESFDYSTIEMGRTLHGLIDVDLPFHNDISALAQRINQVLSERKVLEQENTALARFTGPAGTWRRATLQLSKDAESAPIEMLSFRKREAPRSVQLARGVSEPAREGWALLSTRGVLFIPRSAQPLVRGVLLGSEQVELLATQQRPLEQLPEALIFEHLDALCRLPNVVWSDKEQPSLPEGKIATPAGLLTIQLDQS